MYDDFGDSRRASDALRRSRRAAEMRKKRKRRLYVRRTLIVLAMLLIVFLVVFLLVKAGQAIFSPSATATPDEATVFETDENGETIIPTEAPTYDLTFKEPNIPDDTTAAGHISSVNGGVYIYQNVAFELFGGSEATAQYYADAVSDFKKKAGDGITVYNMIVPNHTEFGLPRRLIESGAVSTQIQADNIKEIYTRYSADVVPINCYNKLSEHVSEYIYFNTDHHWSGLGAYYAYTAFAEQTGQRTLSLDVCEEHVIDGFEGSLLDCDPSLSSNLDAVHYWTFPYSTYAMRTDNPGEDAYETTVYYENEGSGPYAYGVFIWGDAPLFVEYNTDLDNGKKIAVVKESYGNAFVPYLTADYQEVHVIDMRYFTDNLLTYCQNNGIDEVLFLNNVMAANTAVQVDRIRALYE